MSDQRSLPWKFSLVFERSRGQWLVTSPDIRGLLVADEDFSVAASMVPKAYNDLLNASELAPPAHDAEGKVPVDRGQRRPTN